MFGNAGAKFVVQFSIEGSGEKDLEKILGLMKAVGAASPGKSGGDHGGVHAGLGKAKTAAEGLTGSLEHAHEAMAGVAVAATAVSETMDRVAEIGVKMMEVGVGILHGWETLVSKLVEKGGEFESMLLRMQATGKTGREAIGMMKDAIEFTQKLPLTESDAVRIMSTLAVAHVDALKPIGETYDELAKKGKTLKDLPTLLGTEKMKKEGPNAVTLVGDVLAAMGHLGSSYQGMAIHELMEFIETGTARSAKTFGPMVTEVRKLGKHAKTAQDRIKGLQEILEHRGALGISVTAMTTLGGVQSNLKGLFDRVAVAVLDPGDNQGLQTRVVMALQRLYEAFNEGIKEHGPTLASIKGMFSVVFDALIFAMDNVAKVVKVTLDFIGDHPIFMKLVVGSSLVVAAMLILGGAAIALSATLLGAIAVIAMLPEVFLVIPVAIGLVIVSIAALTAALAAGYTAYKLYEANFAGVKTFFADVGLIIDATREALDDWNGSMASISEETYQKLEKAGLTGFFLRAIYWIRQAQVYWEGFSDAIEQRWTRIGMKFGEAWDRGSAALGRIMVALGHVIGVLLQSNTTVDATTKKGEEFGDAVAGILESIADMAVSASEWLDQAVGSVPEVVDSLADIYETIIYIKNGFDIVWDVGTGTFLALASGVSLVLGPLILLYDYLKMIVKAWDAMASGDFSKARQVVRAAGDEMSADAKGWLGRTAGLAMGAGRQFNKVWGEFEDMGEGQAEADAMRKKGNDWRFKKTGAPILDAPSPVPTPPAAIGPPRWEETDEYKVKKEKEDRLAANRVYQAPAPPPLQLKGDVNLDSRKIGDVVWEDVKGRMERAGYQPGG